MLDCVKLMCVCRVGSFGQFDFQLRRCALLCGPWTHHSLADAISLLIFCLDFYVERERGESVREIGKIRARDKGRYQIKYPIRNNALYHLTALGPSLGHSSRPSVAIPATPKHTAPPRPVQTNQKKLKILN